MYRTLETFRLDIANIANSNEDNRVQYQFDVVFQLPWRTLHCSLFRCRNYVLLEFQVCHDKRKRSNEMRFRSLAAGQESTLEATVQVDVTRGSSS